MLDNSDSLDSFLEIQIGKAKEPECAEIFEKILSSRERPEIMNYKSNYLHNTYISLDDGLFKDYMSHEIAPDPETFKKLLEKFKVHEKQVCL
jgi:hypothetical protein